MNEELLKKTREAQTIVTDILATEKLTQKQRDRLDSLGDVLRDIEQLVMR